VRERPEDTGIAVGLALGLHLLAVLLMYVGWRFGPAPQALSVAGPPIEVEFLATAPLQGRPTPVPPPEPEQQVAPPPQAAPPPEPAPPDALVEPQPTPPAVPDVREQERAARDALAPEPPAAREQDERRRQEQIDLTERIRQLASLREQREQSERQTRREEQRMEQQRDLAQRQPPAPQPAATAAMPNAGPATPMAGNHGVDTGLEAAYRLAIQNAVERNWIRPETIPPGTPCRIRVIQIPGGEVISAEVVQPCTFDAIGQRSLEAAVLRAEPLPFTGFETVFRRELLFTFKAPPE